MTKAKTLNLIERVLSAFIFGGFAAYVGSKGQFDWRTVLGAGVAAALSTIKNLGVHLASLVPDPTSPASVPQSPQDATDFVAPTIPPEVLS